MDKRFPNRHQRVRVGNHYSPMTKVLSSIPQGGVLGPILFTIFINNLPNCVQSCCKVFADDTKIYESTNNAGGIQEDIIRLQRWSDLWNLYFNVTKCKILHIGKNNQEIDYKMKLSEDKLMTNSKMRRGEGSRCYFR